MSKTNAIVELLDKHPLNLSVSVNMNEPDGDVIRVTFDTEDGEEHDFSFSVQEVCTLIEHLAIAIAETVENKGMD